MGDAQSAQREGRNDAEEESGTVDDAQTEENTEDKVSAYFSQIQIVLILQSPVTNLSIMIFLLICALRIIRNCSNTFLGIKPLICIIQNQKYVLLFVIKMLMLDFVVRTVQVLHANTSINPKMRKSPCSI